MFKFAYMWHPNYKPQIIKCNYDDRKPIYSEESIAAYFGAQKQWYII